MHNEFWSCLDGEVPGVSPRVEVVEGRRALCRQNLGAERPLVTASERLKSPRLEGVLASFGEKRDGASITPLALPCR